MRFLSTSIFICIIFLFSQKGIAQCPQITISTATATGDVCPGDMVTFEVQGNDLPSGGTVDWYIGQAPFNPAFGQGTLIGSSDITGASVTPTPCNPCPMITGALIDACVEGSGNEADNEFITLSSGGGFDLNDFYVDIPMGNNAVPSVNGDFNIGGFCTWQSPDAGLMGNLNSGGCSGLFVPVNPGESIPPEAIVMVFPSAGQTFTFDFSTFCSTGQTVYVIQNGCDRTIGALTNGSAGGGTRTYTIGLSCCATSWTYDRDLVDGGNGAFVYVSEFGFNIYNNAGCFNPTIEAIPTTPQPDPVVDPFTYTFDNTYCNSMQSIVGYIPNQAGGCTPLTNYFDYNIICPETSFSTSMDVCDDGTGMASFNLTSIEGQINGSSGSPVYFFENSNLTNQINNTLSYNSGTDIIYAQVGTPSAVCGNTSAQIFLNVNPAPTADPVTATQCDNGSGMGNFDLFNIASQVNSFAGNTINFFLNSDGTGPIATVSNYNTGTVTIYAVVTDNIFNCPSQIVPITLNITPTANPADVNISVSPTTACGITNVQVTLTLPTPGMFTVYLEEQNSALTVIPFMNVSNGDVLDFFGVTETTTYTLTGVEANGCLSTYSIAETVTISSAASATATSLSDCDDGTGISFFDLNDAASIINGGTGAMVNFYADAGGVTPIPAGSATNYPAVDNTIVYATVGFAPCESMTVSLTLIVEPAGNADIGSDGTICSGESADLTVTFTNGNPPYSFNLLQNGASPQFFDNVLSSPFVISISPTTNTSYTINNAIGDGCAMTVSGSAQINVAAAPTVSLSPTQTICQGESGEIVFIFMGTPPFDFTYTENSSNPVSITENTFTYTINPSPTATTIYTVTALSDMNCSGNGSLPISTQINVTPTETANDATLSNCGDATNSATFDLNDAVAQINSGSGSPVNFYIDAAAMSSISAVDAESYTVTGNTTVYATIGSGVCASNIIELELIVNPQGLALISGDAEICTGESVNMTVSFSGANSPYSFSLQADGVTVETFDNIMTTVFNIPAQVVLGTTDFTIIDAEGNGCDLTEAGNASITITPTPTADISGDQTICEGDDATLVFTFTGTPPFDFTYLSDGGSPQDITTSDLNFTLDVSPTVTTVYAISDFEDGNCDGTVSGSATVTVISTATAEISADGTVCEGDSYDLTIDFTGSAPFSFIYTVDGSPQTQLTTSDDPYTLTVNPTGTSVIYGLNSVSSANCPGTVSLNTATVTVSQAPTATLISTTCNADNLTYNVTFEISGGTAPYTVTGGDGSLDATGTIFTSDNINSQTNYNFSIDDVLNCGPVTLSGTQDCSCLNSAGTMDFPSDIIELCETEAFTFTHNGDEIVETGDVFGFIIHENPNPELSLPFQWNPTSATFDFTGFLQLNTTYYVSAVTGNPDATGTSPFDTTDPCLSVSAGVPVVWRANPMGTLSIDDAVCEGDDATLTFDFTGTAPFTYTYNINGEMPSITQQTNDNQVVTTIPITENTVVTLETVEDDICLVDIDNAVGVSFNENVAAMVTDTICASDISSYQIVIEVTGEESYNVVSSVSGGGFMMNTYTSGVITSGDPYIFEVTDANNCNTIVLEGLFVCEFSCVGDLGEMDIDVLDLCVGETATAIYDNTDEDIETGDLLQYVIHGNPGTSLGGAILIQNTPDFVWDATLYMPNTVYYISVISGDNDGTGNVDLADPCLLINEGQPVTWNQGSAMITSIDESICNDACTDITIEVQGVPDYEIIISDGMGGSETLTDFNTTITYNVCPDVETTYTITEISTNGCPGLIGSQNSVTISPQSPFTFQNFLYNCSADNSEYSATFNLTGGTPPYTLVSGAGDLVVDMFTSDLTPNNTLSVIEFVDNLGCPLTVTLQNDCDCMNAPATVVTDLQELCLGDFAEIMILSDPIFGPDNVSAYYLHNGTATELGNITYGVTNDIFNQEPGGYIPGDTLFFTPVVSPDNGTGFPDLTETCANIGVGFPVVWYPASNITIPADVTDCSDDCQNFLYTFSQEGMHTLELDIDGNIEFFSTTGDEITVTICPVDYGIQDGGIVELSPISLISPGGCATNYNSQSATQFEILAPEITEINPQVCMGDSFIIDVNIFDIDNQNGQVTLQNVDGCDSIVDVNLTFYDMPEGDFMTTLCTGGSIQVGDVVFDATNMTGEVTLTDASYLGCDSLVNVTVNFDDNISFQLDTIICEGNSAFINGETYDINNMSGSFTFVNGSYLGCDSTVNVSLDFFDEIIFDLNDILCADESVTVGSQVFNIDNPTGIVILPLGSFAGCDSTINVNLDFYPVSEFDDIQTLCTGGTYTVGTTIFDVNNPMGTVILEDAALGGCDSTVNVVLTFNDAINANLDTILCSGNTLTINGTVYGADNLAGVETFENGSYLGCDSILNVSISIAQPAIQLIENQLCSGEEFDLEGTIYDENNPTGTQILSTPSFNGCDSIAEVNLTFLPNAVGVLDTILCVGDFVIIGGVTIDESNPIATFTFSGMAQNGCDSTLNVSATFNPISEETIEIFLGNDEEFVLGGQTFDVNNPMGQVIFENQNYLGCDSIINVNVFLLLNIQGEGISPDCHGDSDGSIILDTITFGTPPYTLEVDGVQFGNFSVFPYVINGLSAGNYELTISDAEGNVGESNINVPEALEYTLVLGDDDEIRQGETFTINALTNMDEANIAELIWTPTDSLDNDTTINVVSSILETTTYSLFLQDSMGCSISENITIYVNKESQVYIPNVFSPDESGTNDKFTIFGGEQVVQVKSLKVFDRWGELVFLQNDFLPNDISIGWDGRHNDVMMNNQVLIYMAEIEFIDGRIEIFKGDIMLLR